jgi:DNA-binding IclR family transcriptional regulator
MRHENKLFSLTPAVLRLGQSYLHSARLPRIAQPLLYRLAYSLGEAASVGVLDHDQLVCVAAVSAGQLVSATLQPGTRVPAYCTANGRMLLASLPQAQIERFLARADPERSPRTRSSTANGWRWKSRAPARRAMRWSTRNWNWACARSPCRSRISAARWWRR